SSARTSVRSRGGSPGSTRRPPAARCRQSAWPGPLTIPPRPTSSASLPWLFTSPTYCYTLARTPRVRARTTKVQWARRSRRASLTGRLDVGAHDGSPGPARSERGSEGGSLMRRRWRFIPFLLLAGAAVWAGCAQQEYHPEYRPDPPPVQVPANAIRVGVSPTYPPVIFRKGGEIMGLEADFAGRLSGRLGRPFYFIPVPFEEQIDALLARRTDVIMSGMSITQARAVRVAFTDPYMEIGLLAAVRAEDRSRYPSKEALLQTDAPVGAIDGTTGAVFLQRNFPNARRVGVVTAADGALALRRRSIDVFIHDGPSIAWLVSSNEAELAGVWQFLNKEQLAWAVRRDS